LRTNAQAVPAARRSAIDGTIQGWVTAHGWRVVASTRIQAR
jgi:hypothetical protein